MRKNLLTVSVLAMCLGAAMSANAQSTVTPGQQYQPAGTPPAYEQSTPPADDQRAPNAYPSQPANGQQSQPANGQQMMPRPGAWPDQTPPSGVDATAYSQCHNLSGKDYWDCVNSHGGGGGQ